MVHQYHGTIKPNKKNKADLYLLTWKDGYDVILAYDTM